MTKRKVKLEILRARLCAYHCGIASGCQEKDGHEKQAAFLSRDFVWYMRRISK